MFSYQCSQHSKSEDILEVFTNATRFQEKCKSQQHVSLVVLDNVGLCFKDTPGSSPLDEITRAHNVSVGYILCSNYGFKVIL